MLALKSTSADLSPAIHLVTVLFEWLEDDDDDDSAKLLARVNKRIAHIVTKWMLESRRFSIGALSVDL